MSPYRVALTLGFLLAARALAKREVERRIARTRPRSADGVIRGAAAIDVPIAGDGRADRAALLVHGFGDTPQSLGELARRLHEAGWAVRVPRLPGHGRGLAEFRASRADDWIRCVRDEWRALRDRYPSAALVGQSMGGALATLVAAESQDVPALVLLAPYLSAGVGVRRLARAHWVVDALCPYVPSVGARSIHDPVARRAALNAGALTGRLARELESVATRARHALPAVTAPTLVVQARADNRIPPAAAEAAFRALGASEKSLVWLDGCGHVVSVDYKKARVFELTESWLDHHSGLGTRGPGLGPGVELVG